MITTGLGYLGVLFFTAGLLKLLEQKATKGIWQKFFTVVPSVVCLYLVTMVLGSINLWTMTPEIKATSAGLLNNLLPAMIIILLLRSDARQIIKLGPRMVSVFLVAVLTMMIGFIVAFIMFKHTLGDPDAWKTLSALCGSWVGGSVNMVAIQGALGVPDTAIGYVLTMDTISYALWLILMLTLVPWSKFFDRWTKADKSELEKIVRQLESNDKNVRTNITFTDMVFLIGVATLGMAICVYLADITSLKLTDFANNSTLFRSLSSNMLWQVIYATTLGILGGMTPLGKIPGSMEIGNTMMFLFIAVIGSKVNLSELNMGKMAVYLVMGLVVLVIHFVLLSLAAKLFKFDAYSCQTASLANIGGVASATVISGAYSPALIPIGVVMASIGTICGTAAGLIVAQVLEHLQ